MIDNPEIQLALDEKQDEILTGMPVPQDGKIGDIRTNISHKGKFYQMMKVGIDTHFFSAPFSRVPSIHTMDDYLLKLGGKMLDGSMIGAYDLTVRNATTLYGDVKITNGKLLDAYDVTIRNDLLLSGPTAGTDNTVLVLNSANKVVVDEIDSRVWGPTLVAASGTPTGGHIPYYTAAYTIAMDSGRLFWDAANNRLGIGTANPSKQVNIYRNSAAVDQQLRIEQDGEGDALMSLLLTGTREWGLGIDNSDGDKFKISSAADFSSGVRLTIDTSGNVGIGTMTPGPMLDTPVTASLQLYVGSTSSVYMSLKGGTDSEAMYSVENDARQYRFGISTDDGWYLFDDTANANRFAIDTAGVIDFVSTSRVAGNPTTDGYFVIKLGGVRYKVPCLAV